MSNSYEFDASIWLRNNYHLYSNIGETCDALEIQLRNAKAKQALQAQTEQAVASAAPKYADFANGDAAMWTENGKLKSEWNEAAYQRYQELALNIRSVISDFISTVKPDTSGWQYRRLIMDVDRMATEHLIQQFEE